MFKISLAHPDWYEDGIESSSSNPPAEQLWRLDLDADGVRDIQIQLFAVPVYWDDAKEWFNGPENEWRDAWVLIERDSRDPWNVDHRVHYSCEKWVLSDLEAKLLLRSNKEEVAASLEERIAHVMGLPNRPEYCEPYGLGRSG